jgi:methanogenic corrinoid protein MtbC1
MSSDETARQLTNAIVKGDSLATEHLAKRLVEGKSSVTLALDAIVNAMNIVNDLHSIGEYDRSKVSASCSATLAALQLFEPQLSIEESKAIGTVVLGCIPEDSVGFDRAIASSVLRAAGLKTLGLPTAVTYENLTRIMNQNQCDLVVLLIKTHEGDPRVQTLALEMRESLPKKTLRVLVGGNLQAAKICQKYGFTNHFSDLGDLVSKVTEIMIKQRESR